jgi:hypothetical protein
VVGVLLWRQLMLGDRLIHELGPSMRERIQLDGDLQMELRDCTDQCLPGVSKVGEFRGSLGSDSLAMLTFSKPGRFLGFWYADLPGPHIALRLATDTPGLGIEVTLKDADDDEAKFRCSVPSDGVPRDYLLPREVLVERAVDLFKIQMAGLGPSTSARTPSGRFRWQLYGITSTDLSDRAQPCVGLLKKRGGGAPAPPEPPAPSNTRPAPPSSRPDRVVRAGSLDFEVTLTRCDASPSQMRLNLRTGDLVTAGTEIDLERDAHFRDDRGKPLRVAPASPSRIPVRSNEKIVIALELPAAERFGTLHAELPVHVPGTPETRIPLSDIPLTDSCTN